MFWPFLLTYILSIDINEQLMIKEQKMHKVKERACPYLQQPTYSYNSTQTLIADPLPRSAAYNHIGQGWATYRGRQSPTLRSWSISSRWRIRWSKKGFMKLNPGRWLNVCFFFLNWEFACRLSDLINQPTWVPSLGFLYSFKRYSFFFQYQLSWV